MQCLPVACELTQSVKQQADSNIFCLILMFTHCCAACMSACVVMNSLLSRGHGYLAGV
jgi:hypothetical protein